MGNYTIFQMFENPSRGRQARNFGKNVLKILDLKSSSEQKFSENCRWAPLIPYPCLTYLYSVHETVMLFLKPDVTKKNRELFFLKDLYGVIRA